MPLILPSNSISAGGYEVDNSLRFDDGSSDFLSRTAPTPIGSRRIFTVSCWVKRTDLGSTDQDFYSNYLSTDNMIEIRFTSVDTLRVHNRGGASSTIDLRTSRVFRDVSAFYNVVVAFDTTQATSSDRVKIYINGVQETSFSTSTYPSLNEDLMNEVDGTYTNFIGKRGDSAAFLDGYLAESVYVNNSALDPTSFGEFDEDTGIWKPISVSGLTFGTNGFYLDFENSGSLGADVSGNGNNFTVNNLTSIDQTTDTCTNNACTWNPLRFWNRSGTLQSPSFDNGNLRAIFDDAGYNEYAFASIGVDKGKWFCEMKAEDITASNNTRIGVLDMDYTGTGNPGDQSTTVSYAADGQKRVGGSNSSYGASYTNGDIIGVALDCDNDTVTFYKNGVSQGAISITANILYTFYSEDYASSGNKEISANFSSPAYAVSSGNQDGNGYGNFEYSVPSGYYALNTKNLAEYG